jgi:hypothetical protein
MTGGVWSPTANRKPRRGADLLNDRVLPFLDEHDVKLLRVLTDRGSEYCGNHERHEYELYLAVEDIDHSGTKTKSPQTNGICGGFRKKVYRSIDELQVDLDLWVCEYNEQRPHQGRWCFGKTPMQTFLDAMPFRARCEPGGVVVVLPDFQSPAQLQLRPDRN